MRASGPAGHEAVSTLSKGYETRIAEVRHHLSAHQLRAISLARALYRDPALIVVDNADTRLDESGYHLIHGVIRSCRERGQTLVMISDRPSIVRALDWVALLVEGRLEGMVRPEKLLSRLGLLKGGDKQPVVVT